MLINFSCFAIGKDDENKRGKDNAPYGEYGGWHKAAKVDRYSIIPIYDRAVDVKIYQRLHYFTGQ